MALCIRIIVYYGFVFVDLITEVTTGLQTAWLSVRPTVILASGR